MSSSKADILPRSRSTKGPPLLYHVQDGLFVGRGRKGAVILEIRESQDYRSRILYRTEFSPSRWTAMIARVAVGVLTDLKVAKAENFHFGR
jgi:hypothetical protein